MIAIKNVDFSYTEEKKHGSIQNITINIASGECVLLCGKSGCGKTTITKLINGLIPHFNNGELSGETVVDDMKVEDTPLYKLSQKVGSVFQNPKSQFFNIDSDSELAFGLENNGVAPEKIKTRIDKTVSDLHIEHLLHRNVFSMSGGEKQSLAFASVYAMNPDIYVLDEPSANLDIGAVETLKAQIQQIKLHGKSIVIAEHRLHYLTDLIDRVIVIADGHIEKEFTREEFISLTNEECHKMGLRSLTVPEHIGYTSADSTGTLEIKHLTVKNKKHIIFEDLNFSVSEGNILGVLGENGAGKTTLMRCLSGLIKEHSGEICYEGKPMKLKSRNKLCYMIMQDVNHQLFGESVWNECELCRDKNITDEQIEEILKSFDLFEFKDKHPMALSGGQKQRLAIATGVIAEKKILLFDEPTSGLDYEHMVTVSETLKHLADLGHIIIVVTHDLEFLYITCDAVIQMGKKEYFSPKQ